MSFALHPLPAVMDRLFGADALAYDNAVDHHRFRRTNRPTCAIADR